MSFGPRLRPGGASGARQHSGAGGVTDGAAPCRQINRQDPAHRPAGRHGHMEGESREEFQEIQKGVS